MKKLVPKRFNTKKLYSNALRTVKQKEQNFISVGQGLNWVNWGRYPIQQGFETNLENQRTIELGLPNPRYREAALLEKCSIQGLLKTKLMHHTKLRFLAKTRFIKIFLVDKQAYLVHKYFFVFFWVEICPDLQRK